MEGLTCNKEEKNKRYSILHFNVDVRNISGNSFLKTRNICRIIKKYIYKENFQKFCEDKKKLTTRVVQKVKSHIFVFFFKQRQNKLPRRECSGGLYDHTVKIMFLIIFRLVKVELPEGGAAKFEMCVIICFLHAG